MSNQFKQTWEGYVSSWKVTSPADKKELFEQFLDPSCQYTDPLANTTGWDELIGYMQSFHQQLPGGHFATTYFLAHHNKSVAKWEMRNEENAVLGDGISYAEYNDEGKLIAINGFYETPQ